MNISNYTIGLRYALVALILILITDLYIFPILDMIHGFKLEIGPKGWQTFLLFAAIIGVVCFYFYQKNKTIPLLPSDDTYTANVVVIEYTNNEVGDIDGIVTSVNEQRLLLNFPPHTASKVMQVAAKGNLVEVRYTKGKMSHDQQKMKLETIHNIQSGQSVNIAGILVPMRPGRNENKEIIITEKHFNTDAKGRINGFVSGNTFVEIKPHVMTNLMNSIKEAKHISIEGIYRIKDDGFVNIYNREVIRATSIKLDSNTYSIY